MITSVSYTHLDVYKRQLLNMIGGLETPTAGVLTIDGKDISTYSEAEMVRYRRDKAVSYTHLDVYKRQVHEKDGRYFVYTLDENGDRQAVWISAGDQVGDYRSITEGLKSGDEVVLQ